MVSEGNEKNIRCDNKLDKCYQTLSSATADAENLPECTEYNRGKRLL
jgi:hypothetical protein